MGSLPLSSTTPEISIGHNFFRWLWLLEMIREDSLLEMIREDSTEG